MAKSEPVSQVCPSRAAFLDQVNALSERLFKRLQSTPNAKEPSDPLKFLESEIRTIANPEDFPTDDAIRALATLSRDQIELFVLSHQGLHYTEIARRVQWPPDEVLRELSRAKALCRFALFPR